MTIYSFKTVKVVQSVFKTDKLSKIVWSYVPLENSALGLCTDVFFFVIKVRSAHVVCVDRSSARNAARQQISGFV